MFFAATCAGAWCSAYANREYLDLYYQGQPLNLSQRDWIVTMSVLWAFVIICMVSIALNHYLNKSCEIRVCGGGVVLFGWRQTEGLIALGLTGKWYFVPSNSSSKPNVTFAIVLTQRELTCGPSCNLQVHTFGSSSRLRGWVASSMVSTICKSVRYRSQPSLSRCLFFVLYGTIITCGNRE